MENNEENLNELTGQVTALMTLFSVMAGSLPASMAVVAAGNVTIAKAAIQKALPDVDGKQHPCLASANRALEQVEFALSAAVQRGLQPHGSTPPGQKPKKH